MRAVNIVGPIFLIGLGLLFLLNNFGFHIPFGRLIGQLWPLFLIVPGVLQILRATAAGPVRADGALTGGVVMVTVGGLFLLQNITGIGFGRTWPLLLIAIGLLGVMRFSGASGAGPYGRGGFRR